MRYSNRPHSDNWRGESSRGWRVASKFRGVKPVEAGRLEALLSDTTTTPKEDTDMTVMEKVTDLAKKLSGARDAVRELRDSDAALRQAHAEAAAERQRLIGSQAPKADVIGAMEAAVDAIATEARDNLGPRLVQALSGGVEVAPSGGVLGIRAGNLAHAFVPQPLTIGDLAAFCPDVLKANLRACIEGARYEAGPVMKDRLSLIEKVDARIADLERQHAELVDSAAEAGITLQHLEANRIRRLQEAQRAERLAREARGRPRGDRG